jgi:hypothetical protein
MSDDGITGAILKPLENLNDVIFIGLTMTACCAEFGPFVQKYESYILRMHIWWFCWQPCYRVGHFLHSE